MQNMLPILSGTRDYICIFQVKSPTPEVPDDDDDLRLLDDVDASSEEEDEDKEAIFEQSRSEVDLLENDGEKKVECGIRSAAVRQQQSAAVAAGKTVTFKLAATKDGGGKEDESMMANNNLLNKSAAEVCDKEEIFHVNLQ